ncbi:MAG: PDR/VanB family oxidoreductase [Pseudomonadota bacterium]
MDLLVDRITDLTDRIREFRLVGANACLPAWAPGSHIDLDLGVAGARSYSLIDWTGDTSAPDHYTIAVQREDDGSGGSKAMHALTVGGKIEASDPKNDFELPEDDLPVTLLAGGIGVTPMISMAASLAAHQRPFQLHYAVRSRDAAAYTSLLADRYSDNTYLHIDSEAPADLRKIAKASANGHLAICGPIGMIDAARSAAEAAGIPSDRIHVELFSSPAPTTGDQPFEVEIHDTGQVFTVPPGQTIISVLEAGGVDLVYDCQRGDCGICQVDVIDGTPDHRDVVLTDAEKAANDVMQICVSRAKSPRLVLDL